MRKKHPLTPYLSNSFFYLVLKKKTGKKCILLGKTVTEETAIRWAIPPLSIEVGKAGL